MSFIRAAKYYTKGYSEIQTKVRDATSNADQPPTGRMLNEISQMSFDPYVPSRSPMSLCVCCG